MTRRARTILATAAAIGAIAAGGVVATAMSASASTPAATEPAVVELAAGDASSLRFEVTGPATVVAGTEATFTTTWSDTDGDLLGAIEDWGDVGVGSIAPPGCEDDASSASATPSNGGDALTHTWDEPGTYDVTLGVTTGGCGIEEETETVTFAVTVR